MFLETPDQELFESSTRRFLETHYPTARVRELASSTSTFEPAIWREAAELGWTTLLVPEAAGGGSISGNGLADLLIVSSLFGQHAAPGPLFGTNLVASALGRWGSPDQQGGPLVELLAGDAVAAWGHDSAVAADVGAAGVVLNGRVANVESDPEVSYVLVTADGRDGSTHYLVPVEAPGVGMTPLRSVDLTRRFHDVTLHNVELPADARVGDLGAAQEHDELLLDTVAVMAQGEIVGAMHRAFGMTLEWTMNRYSFGRPLASYQAIKHRVADIRTQLEASEAVAARSAFAVGTGEADGPAWASAGMTYVGRHGPELIQECVQLHGGIGVTYDHDLHVYLRRATLDANLFGRPNDFAHRLGALVATAGAAS